MRPFFLRIYRKGKRKHKPHNDTRTNKAGKRTSRGQEDKQRKLEQRGKKKGKHKSKRTKERTRKRTKAIK